MLNLWIGLCRGEAGLPTDIRRLGYKHEWIEYEFQNSIGEPVKPELIIASDRYSHAVMFEWKEGPNTEGDQLKRYSMVVSDDLIKKAALNPSVASVHDVCIVGLINHIPRLSKGIKNGNYSFPLIGVEEDGLSLQENDFAVNELTGVVSPKLAIDFSKVPTQLVPFDHNSQYWEIAERIIPQIIVYMTRGEPRFILEKLLDDCAPVCKSVLAPSYRHDLATKVQHVINEASRHEFKGFFKRDKKSESRTHSATWEIKYNPMALLFDKRSVEFRKLQRLQAQFINALRTGKRNPSQLSFEDIIA